MKQRKNLTLVVFLFITLWSFAQVTTVQFTENTGNITNPERGFYRHTTSHNANGVDVGAAGSNYIPLTQAQLTGYRNGGSTIILRLFYIHEFAGLDHISQDYLNKMTADFQMLRANGMKAFIRFAYSNRAVDKDRGITLARIQNHLADVKPILEANKDVITAVQAGLVGAWGEWYYTNNFGDQGQITNQEWIKRYDVITALLQNVPSSIMVQLRSPAYKTRYLQHIGESTSAVNEAEAYNITLAKARLGHHNDCFLSTPDNKVKTITIPKSLLTNIASTVTIGYRALKNFVPVNQAQLPIPTNPMINYVLGSSTATNGVVDWENTPNLTFPYGFILSMKAADDANNIYIQVAESGYLDSDAYELFINKDNNSTTGWIDLSAWTTSGADVLLQNGILYNYTGANNVWGWTPTATGTTIANSVSDAYDDVGTYTNPGEIDYITSDSKFVIVGGESCIPNNQNQCAKSVARMEAHHYTYINTDYHPDVVSRWDTQGCYSDMVKRLGYRLRLTESRIQSTVNAGKKLAVSIDITNDGFAAPHTKRDLELVLTNTSTNQEFKIKLESSAADVRFWQPGNTTINESILIPATLPVGSYSLALNLPDKETSINTDPNFSIQFANQNTWNATKGYNSLQTTINVLSQTGGGTPSIIIDGNATDWQDVDILSMGTGNIQTLKSYDDGANIYFIAQGTLGNQYTLFMDADGKSYTGYNGAAQGADYKIENGNIYRHDFEESWIQIAATLEIVHNGTVTEIKIPKTALYGLGTTVKFTYNDVQNSAVQATLPVSGLHPYTLNYPLAIARPAITITVDGNPADWLYLDAISSNAINLKQLKVYDDASNIYLLVKGLIGDYQAFFNTDNNATTGLVADYVWTGMGADYAIIGGSLYKHDPTTAAGTNGWAWTSIGAVSSQVVGNSHEISISKSLLNALPMGNTINVGYRKLANNVELARIPAVGGMAQYTIENGAVPDLLSLVISDSPSTINVTIAGGKINPMYRVYLDTDNNPATGNNDGNWTSMGAEFLVENGSLFSYNTTTTAWDFVTSNIQVTDDLTPALKTRSIAISRTLVSTLTAGNIINVGYMNLTNTFAVDGKLPETGGLQPYIIQNNYVPDLETITVSDDANAITIVITGSNITATYELLMNTDGQPSTGFIDTTWSPMGADYLLQNGSFYKHNQANNTWGWTPVTTTVTVTDITLTATTSQRTIVILKTAFTALANSIDVGYRNVVNGATAATIPAQGGTMFNHSLLPQEQIIGETGALTASQANEFEWKTVNLTQTYTNPVVIFSPLSFNDNEPAAIRVKNVTSTSFQYQIDEWDYLDEQHDAETFFYLVVEAGNYNLDGGVLLEAGTSTVDDSWSEITFNNSFSNTPLLFSQVMSYNDDEAVVTRIKWIDNETFQLKVQAEEANSNQGHANETIGWLAFSEGTGNAGRIYEIDGTAREYDHIFYEIYFNNTYTNPIAFATMQTDYEDDTAGLRYDDLQSDQFSIKVEEERSADYETNHTNEEIGFAVFEGSGTILGTPIQISKEALQDKPTIQTVNTGIHIYPNPLQNGAQLTIESTKNLEYKQLYIYNSTGRLIKKIDKIKHLETIDTRKWSNGIYFITVVKNNGEQQQFKVINIK